MNKSYSNFYEDYRPLPRDIMGRESRENATAAAGNFGAALVPLVADSSGALPLGDLAGAIADRFMSKASKRLWRHRRIREIMRTHDPAAVQRREQENKRHGPIHRVQGGQGFGQYLENPQESYNILINYLLDEGYANSIGSAEIIAENMSEIWINSILY